MGDSRGAYCPPQLLTVTSGKPGSITVGAGGEGFLVLEHGVAHLRGERSVSLYRLLPAFAKALAWFDAAVAQCFKSSDLPTSEHVTYWSEIAYFRSAGARFARTRMGMVLAFFLCPLERQLPP